MPSPGPSHNGRWEDYLFFRPSISPSTRLGSASVDVSPSDPKSFSAILRKIRRMILPERVLGRPGVRWIWSGVAIGPISLRTCCLSRSEEHTSELQSLMRISYAVFCLKKKITHRHITVLNTQYQINRP